MQEENVGVYGRNSHAYIILKCRLDIFSNYAYERRFFLYCQDELAPSPS